MIVGDGTTAEYTRQVFGEVPWLWVCQDVETDGDGIPDLVYTGAVVHEILDLDHTPDVVISTQLPVGTCALLEHRDPTRRFAIIPENYRTTQDVATVDRLVVGTRSPQLWDLIHSELAPPMLRVSPESAEMVKHGLNGFLALSVQYSQELARLALLHGADPHEVAAGLMSDPRIGEKAYLKPVGGLGPHLIRELHTLAALGGGPLINTLEALCWR